jgi:hypothetical protein
MSLDNSHPVLNHPAVFKLRYLTLPLLHHLEQTAAEKRPEFQTQVKELLAVCSRHLTHVTVLASQGINFYETDQVDPTHYHPLSYLQLEQEDVEEFIGEEVQKSDCYTLMSENTPAGLYLVLGTMQRKDSEKEQPSTMAEEGTIEMYDFSPLREVQDESSKPSEESARLTPVSESDWMVTVSTEIKLDKHAILQPLGLLYLATPQPETIMALICVSKNVHVVNISLITLPPSVPSISPVSDSKEQNL